MNNSGIAINIPLILCGCFYALLCVFSIVTGIIYMTGKRELNPLELSDSFMEKLQDPDKLKSFTKKMGLVTFIVGIVQGITALAIFMQGKDIYYWIAVGFTLFSIFSVGYKLKGNKGALCTSLATALPSFFIILLNTS